MGTTKEADVRDNLSDNVSVSAEFSQPGQSI